MGWLRDSSMLDNLPWHALHTEHAHLAIAAPQARKYPMDVSPFGGTANDNEAAYLQLLSLLEPQETVYVVGDIPASVPGRMKNADLPVLQMIASHAAPRQEMSPMQLSAADADDMVGLTDLAFPGFFRKRTYQMGVYFGIRLDGLLIAMAGERMAVPGYREVSGVCTHPDHTGKGYAAELITHLLRVHADAGVQSFLNVGAANSRAIALYRRLGFTVRKEYTLHALRSCPPRAER